MVTPAGHRRPEARRYIEAIKRREAGSRYRVDDETARLVLDTDHSLLDGERCRIADGALDGDS